MVLRTDRLTPGGFGSTRLPSHSRHGQADVWRGAASCHLPLTAAPRQGQTAPSKPNLTRAVMNARTKSLGIGAFLSALSILSTLAVSCGGGKAAKPLTEDDFCSQKAVAECEIATTCSVPVTDCTTKRQNDCTAWKKAIKDADPQRVFRPENVPACVSKVAAVYNQTKIKPADFVAIDDVCNYVFQ